MDIYINVITFQNLSNVNLSVWPSKKHIQMVMVLLGRMRKVLALTFYGLYQNYIKLIKNISSEEFDLQRKRIALKLNSIYFNEGSSEAADLAAGSVIEILFYRASNSWTYANAITFHDQSNVCLSGHPRNMPR